jgi:hypothetical protein
MKKQLTTLFLSLLLLPVSAQQQQTAQAYADVLAARSAKIVQTLGITDSTKYHRVVDYVVNHYATVGRIQDVADSTVKALKLERLDKEELELRIKAFQTDRDAKLYAQHAVFQAQLQGELSPEQVEGVKNGLTYNVLNVTYKATLEMIPTLKEDEKRQIWIWLLEAREHAIDASSSDAKHGWFGKYKGRINNYLAARGYDLTKERAAWAERIKQQKTN